MSTTGANAQDMIVKAKGDKLRFDMTSPNGPPTHGIFDPKESAA